MRCLLLLILTCSFFTTFAQTDAVTNPDYSKVNPELQKKYLPEGYKNLYVGIPLETVKKIRPKATTEGSILGYEHETFKTGLLKEITYQNINSDVYEFIFEYNKTTAEVEQIALKLYGKPNAGEDGRPYKWSFQLQDGLKLFIWVFKNKICIADAKMF